MKLIMFNFVIALMVSTFTLRVWFKDASKIENF